MKMSGKKQVTVAEAVAAVNALVEKSKQAQQRDVLQGREVVGVYLTPLSPDGKSGGQVVKNIRTGPVKREFAEPTPYYETDKGK